MLRMLIGSALVALCAAVAFGQASNPSNQSLQVIGGPRIEAVFDRDAKTFKVDLKNGTYKLDNDGAIRNTDDKELLAGPWHELYLSR